MILQSPFHTFDEDMPRSADAEDDVIEIATALNIGTSETTCTAV